MKGEFEHRLKNAVYAVTGLLLVLAVWGAGRLLFLSEPEPVAPAPASLQVDAVNYPESSVEANGEIVERPLFWQGRRPPEGALVIEIVDESAEGTPKTSAIFEKMKLLGLYGGETPGVIIMYEGQQRRVRLSETIEEWTVMDVTPEGAVFRNGSQFRIVDLKHANASQQAAIGKNRGRRKLTNKK
jgi:hypothetical protein